MQEIKKINSDNTINSGQVFLWDKIDGVWYGINGSEVLKIKESPFEVISSKEKTSDIFRQDDNLKKILENISRDKFVKLAVSKFPGLRVMRQDPFQCYISFICSSNASIPNIRLMLKKICRKFGQKVSFDGYDFFTFPKPKKLATARLKDLLSCGLGFRAKYVKKASYAVVSGKINFDLLKKMEYNEAREKLVEIYGIGNKIADCILLFSLEKLEAFPIDRWIGRILQKYYSGKFKEFLGKSLSKKRYTYMHKKIVEHFGPYAGYSQQFLFKIERELNNGRWL